MDTKEFIQFLEDEGYEVVIHEGKIRIGGKRDVILNGITHMPEGVIVENKGRFIAEDLEELPKDISLEMHETAFLPKINGEQTLYGEKVVFLNEELDDDTMPCTMLSEKVELKTVIVKFKHGKEGTLFEKNREVTLIHARILTGDPYHKMPKIFVACCDFVSAYGETEDESIKKALDKRNVCDEIALQMGVEPK